MPAAIGIILEGNLYYLFPSNVTADQIEETLKSIPESMPALELLQSAPTDEATVAAN